MVELEPHKVGRRLDKHFRWRGTEVSRVEAIADAVFGLVLAMVLLAEHPPGSFAAMFVAIKALIPLAATFAIVAMIWFEHYLFFRRYDLHDGTSIALTFVLLFLVVGFAYPLKLVFTLLAIMAFGPIGELDMRTISGGVTSSSQVLLAYSLAFCAVYTMLALLYGQALRHRADLELDEREVFLTRSTIIGQRAMLAVGLLSVALCLIGLLQGAGAHAPLEERPFLDKYGVAGWVYFLIGPVMTVHGAWEGRHLRLLTAQPESEAPEKGAPAA